MLSPISTGNVPVRFGQYTPMEDIHKKVTENLQQPLLDIWFNQNRNHLEGYLKQRVFPGYTKARMLKDLYRLMKPSGTDPNAEGLYRELKSEVHQAVGDPYFHAGHLMDIYEEMSKHELVSLDLRISLKPWEWARVYYPTEQGRYILDRLERLEA